MREIVQCISARKYPAERVSLPSHAYTKVEGLGPEEREPGELSKAECSSTSVRIKAQLVKLSSSGLPLSSVFYRYRERD